MRMDFMSLPADHRIPYGPDASQFGDLWLPLRESQTSIPTPHPLIVFFHGGWWKSAYDLGHASHLCAAFRRAGIAVWSIEYRRVGFTGGGWPHTFHDATAGLDFVTKLAKRYPLDPSRVITAGHSAGGHLALWVAGRYHINARSELFLPRPQVCPSAASSPSPVPSISASSSTSPATPASLTIEKKSTT